VVFLLTSVLAGVVPLIHHHTFAIRLTPDPQVSTHTCGLFERHIPLDVIHGCFTCWQSSQRESTPAEGVSTGYAGIVADVVHERSARQPRSFSWLLPGKRGPPVVA
jgi:hypothetical protein